MDRGWQFFIDRGGTFTDVIGVTPGGSLVVRKVLSTSDLYEDAAIAGIEQVLAEHDGNWQQVRVVKMGTTVATNALLERKGGRVALITNTGFGDALRIAYQHRPHIFARKIVLPEMLYETAIEIDARVLADGKVELPLHEVSVRQSLESIRDSGIDSCAVALMHSYRYPEHELEVGALAREIGFNHVFLSHQVSPTIKLIARGDTTVVDAYVTPLLHSYIERLMSRLPATRVFFMQSNGGLADAHSFQGKDSILSGPAGGVVGAALVSRDAGFTKVIGFDMGGTSTDLSHFTGEYERTYDTELGGIRIRVPMMHVHTIAAGGGSILKFDGDKFRVGPQSAGAVPGPACYRRGGPLTLTDCNVLLGKIQTDYFPHLFGPQGNEPIDADTVTRQFLELSQAVKDCLGMERCQPEEVASGFLRIAVDNMARAIKKISVQRGYDVREYVLCAFGGAAAQHACLVAEALDMSKVLIPRHAGLLSALGIGMADIRCVKDRSVQCKLSDDTVEHLRSLFGQIVGEATGEITRQTLGVPSVIERRRVNVRYDGSDTTLQVAFGDALEISEQFERDHKQRFGFVLPDRDLIVESISVELAASSGFDCTVKAIENGGSTGPVPREIASVFARGHWQECPLYRRDDLRVGICLAGPSLIVEDTNTVVIEPGWKGELTPAGDFLLTSTGVSDRAERRDGVEADPSLLEVFNNLFMSVAEEMGSTLQKTSHSVNIKERLDFSCAIFDEMGNLVANAPHMPVHLGSMGESVEAVIGRFGSHMRPGDAYAINSPYSGGTHLPDITVVSPVFDGAGKKVLFYTASRGHHADIGGITPGSMPPLSSDISEEGVLFDCLPLLRDGSFDEHAVRAVLSSGKYPARNAAQNIADLKAQIAANRRGIEELDKAVATWGVESVRAYMRHVQDNAERAVRKAIGKLKSGSFVCPMDDGGRIAVSITVNRDEGTCHVDFSGTSSQSGKNFNAPKAVCKAAVLYVFRMLVDDDIPLNAGCLRPLMITIPEGSLLNPVPPAAVVAGNVETSQLVVDALLAALGVMAASQGTMNNFTFGNERYQYYETIAGGSGAGADFDGVDAVQTHMTNSRLTDPEVLEWRFPVVLEEFSIRQGSGGQGKHHGGNGAVRRVRFLERMTAAVLSSRRQTEPFGLCGGKPGARGSNLLIRANGTTEDLAGTAVREVYRGDVLVIKTPGGGGWG